MSVPVPSARRVLATLLFTDVVGSTERAAALGDARWHALLSRHDAALRRALAAHGGRLVNQFGDGALALLPGPSEAVAAAERLRDGIARDGLQVRAGVHAGECLLVGGDVRGLAVHVAARIAALAGPGEVLVSRTVADLLLGSGRRLEDRGEHALRGVPGRWRLHAAVAAVEVPRLSAVA